VTYYQIPTGVTSWYCNSYDVHGVCMSTLRYYFNWDV